MQNPRCGRAADHRAPELTARTGRRRKRSKDAPPPRTGRATVIRRTNKMSGILINDNSTAVEAYNNLDATSTMLSSAVNKLSSGLQIQTAADDPAGYLVGQYLQEESNGYGQSISNAQDAVSVLQTAQGALNQEASVLQTMNTLATEAANGGVQDPSTSAAAQSEFASL